MSLITEKTLVVDLSDAIGRLKEKLNTLNSNDSSSKQIIRISTELDSDISPMDWLKSIASNSKIYWTSRSNSFEMAGVGECLLLEADSCDKIESTISIALEVLNHIDESVRIYGGIRFPTVGPNGHSADWADFKSCRFLIPRFELVRQNDQIRLACNIRSNELDDFLRITNEFDSALTAGEISLSNESEIVNRQDEPTFDGWSDNIKSIINDFSNGKIEKIVLARQSSFQFKENCDALSLLKRLTGSTPHCYHYYFQPHSGVAFLGASPEQLYSRSGRQIASEALAGTRPRGISGSDDLKLGEELLHNEKELREHNYVVDNIKSALSSICENHSGNNPTKLLKLNRVQHLQTKFNGTLKKQINDSDIINALHPTSAVGGYPSDMARSRIAQCEQFDRGWYAGAVGWLAQDAAEFAVAIRSGLVKENELKLFSGAGIVKGSTPEAEWAEIESKIGSFLSAVTGQ